jgi:putative transposase
LLGSQSIFQFRYNNSRARTGFEWQPPPQGKKVARLPRLNLINIPQHIVQTGLRGELCFYDEDDFSFYLASLEIASKQYLCDVHAYVLLKNSVQIIATPKLPNGIPSMMQSVGRRYVQYANHRYQRSGSLWDRYKSSLIDSNAYLLSCYRYVELRPLQLGHTKDLDAYAWSSFHHHSGHAATDLIKDHPIYLSLGETSVDRCNAYNRLFTYNFDPQLLDYIAETVRAGQILGGDRFKDQIEQIANRRIRPLKRGRPRKQEKIEKPEKPEKKSCPPTHDALV